MPIVYVLTRKRGPALTALRKRLQALYGTVVIYRSDNDRDRAAYLARTWRQRESKEEAA